MGTNHSSCLPPSPPTKSRPIFLSRLGPMSVQRCSRFGTPNIRFSRRAFSRQLHINSVQFSSNHLPPKRFSRIVVSSSKTRSILGRSCSFDIQHLVSNSTALLNFGGNFGVGRPPSAANNAACTLDICEKAISVCSISYRSKPKPYTSEELKIGGTALLKLKKLLRCAAPTHARHEQSILHVSNRIQ